MLGNQGFVFKPCLSPFEVEIPQGIEGRISSYVGPDLSADPNKREICNLDVPSGSGNAILRVYILVGEKDRAEEGKLHLLKYDDTSRQWNRITKQRYEPIQNQPWPGYFEAVIPMGDPPIALGE